jgi:hypothetical protein
LDLGYTWEIPPWNVGVILLGISTEGISRVWHDLAKKARNSATKDHLKYTLYQTGLHGLHALSGYLLMLATMTFSCKLMLSVILGLVIGYYRFGVATLSTANPCCAFLGDESDSPTRFGAVNDPAMEPLLPRGTEAGSALRGEGGCGNGGSNTGGQSSDSDVAGADAA